MMVPSTVLRLSSSMPDTEIIAIATTFSSKAAAEACGSRLVESRLAACVQVEGPITSFYRWQAAVDTAVEWRCICKTAVEREAECVAAILSSHGYATPQIAVTRLTSSSSYAAWVRESVASA